MLEVRVARRLGALDLAIELSLDRETVLVAGPNGAGKSTLLRLLLGVLRPDAGRVAVDGAVLFDGDAAIDVPAEERRLAYLPQDYALFPHLDVLGNATFGLSALDRRERVRRATGWLERLGAGHLLDRSPSALSGGERQRVALARALVREPQVFLLDEPLSNLDAKLRSSARDELKEFQQRVAITTIYVTHDQVEAMGLGDRIAVLNEGKIQQIGTPDQIYHHPANTFVATFVGSPPMNLLTRDGKLLGFRPEQFLPASAVGERPGQVVFDFAVTRVENLGSDRYVYGHLPGVDPEAKVIAKLPSTVTTPVYVGDRVPFAVSGGDLRYFDQQTGTRTAAGEAKVKP